jgi:cytochrome c553
MRRHFDDLRMIEHLLVSGKLDEGKALAYLLVRRTDEPGIAAWEQHSRQVADAALELTEAPGMNDALRREARVAVACAGCHVAAQSLPVFAAAPALPPDRQTPETRMARHAWAADRLWEGLVGADDARWSRGLAVLSNTPLPFAPSSDASRVATDLQTRARKQLDMHATTVLEDRGAAYGDMLVACAACHSQLR